MVWPLASCSAISLLQYLQPEIGIQAGDYFFPATELDSVVNVGFFVNGMFEAIATRCEKPRTVKPISALEPPQGETEQRHLSARATLQPPGAATRESHSARRNSSHSRLADSQASVSAFYPGAGRSLHEHLIKSTEV